MTLMTFTKLCNYCSDEGNVETVSAFDATPKTTKLKGYRARYLSGSASTKSPMHCQSVCHYRDI